MYTETQKEFQKECLKSLKMKSSTIYQKEDKQLYFSNTDTYGMLLDRDPSKDELHFDFDRIKSKQLASKSTPAFRNRA